MGSIYVMRNTVNGKCYVGQCLNNAHRDRIRQHLNGNTRCRLISNAIVKYGKGAFEWEIITAPNELLDALEICYIKTLNTLAPYGYNLTEGGKNGRRSAETRERIRQARKGIPRSSETCRRVSKARKGQVPWNKGKKMKPFTPEHRVNMSKAHKRLWKIKRGETS